MFKRILSFIFVFIFFMIGWLAIAISMISQEDVEKNIKTIIQRDFKSIYEGEIELANLPFPRIILRDVKLGQDFYAEEISCSFSLLSLLNFSYDISAINLNNSKLRLSNRVDFKYDYNKFIYNYLLKFNSEVEYLNIKNLAIYDGEDEEPSQQIELVSITNNRPIYHLFVNLSPETKLEIDIIHDSDIAEITSKIRGNSYILLSYSK